MITLIGANAGILGGVVERLPLAVAAARLGVSVPTLRRRIKAGVVRAEKEKTAGGVRLVVLLDAPESVTEPSAMAASAARGMPAADADRDAWRAFAYEQQRTISRLSESIAGLVARMPEAMPERAPEVITRRSPDGDQGDHAPVTKPTPGPVDQRTERRGRRPPLWERLVRALREAIATPPG